ncbi:MAG: hypothetical protein L0Z48_08805, partial [candidate division Zixibacteria bacterium]|nr:hypothetical protein [candidate division Zixibacteria bacterium]
PTGSETITVIESAEESGPVVVTLDSEGSLDLDRFGLTGFEIAVIEPAFTSPPPLTPQSESPAVEA